MATTKIAKFNDAISTSTNSSGVEDFEFGKSGYDVDRTNGSSAWFAYFNIVCLIAGTGMLGLPLALKKGGWAGLVMLILAWWMSSYTGVIMQACMYKGKNRRLSSFKEIATESFGAIGGWVSFFFTTWIYIGTPILYLVLAASNLNQLCEGTAGEIGTLAWTIIWCVVVGIPYIFAKSLNNVAWTSFMGLFAVMVTILITIVLAGIDAHNHTGSHKDDIIWEGFPVALATMSFSFGANVVYPNIEGSMKNPKRWPIVLVGAMCLCAVMYIAISVCGYYIYGTDVVSPIYNSVPPGPARIVAIVLITINSVVSAPILLISFALDVEDMLNISVERFGKTKEFLVRAALRSSIMVFVAAVGILIPFFDLLMSLLGAFANCAIVFVFPVLFYWRLTGFRNKPIYELAWNFLIILVGLVGLIFGTKTAIEDLIAAFSDGYDYKI
ncbi:transmembrane amino acid transporter protein-domain-containing protein [Phascolomyces articulosus]|uniref:Transmembrane amino acid transporter protein-domain-containing protein n=1 Tax=Phascolomyces articulosus TaxID=60185 RepID=A0AAD5KHY6_9FUNG|nr:transmembrane amino acid transporter protein-domain-containing protein [Phascolomyces articulosus]